MFQKGYIILLSVVGHCLGFYTNNWFVNQEICEFVHSKMGKAWIGYVLDTLDKCLKRTYLSTSVKRRNEISGYSQVYICFKKKTQKKQIKYKGWEIETIKNIFWSIV